MHPWPAHSVDRQLERQLCRASPLIHPVSLPVTIDPCAADVARPLQAAAHAQEGIFVRHHDLHRSWIGWLEHHAWVKSLSQTRTVHYEFCGALAQALLVLRSYFRSTSMVRGAGGIVISPIL